MAQLVGLILVTLCSLGAAARIEGLDDSLVAYQESLRAHKARELHDDLKLSAKVDLADALGARKARTLELNSLGDGPQHIKLDVFDALSKAVSASPAAAGSSGNTLNLQWRTSNVEAGSSVSLAMAHGCKDEKNGNGFTSCQIDLSDKTNKMAVDIKLKEPLDDATVMENELKVKVLIMEEKTSFKCKACGSPCKIKMFGFEIVKDAPACPLPKNQVSIAMPFEKLTKMPALPSFNGDFKTTVVRGDGSTVATFEFIISK
mmetsp:Transcript_8545/g.27226  ORF Transcript_8545/g.27226 Transcript_8545/m.27226 type:complete len:260 (-) Transcript_8545:91-870(-)